ncbi:MAG: aldo/keto reductase [Propionibacteriaceae bacterium]|nr:aldo/keto reductase [Propionibacteriaceae bacterium]
MKLQMNDGREIPALGYGTWRVTNEQSEACVIDALSVGYRHIDTARIYENEVGVGSGIAHSGIDREEIFLTTKLWTDGQEDPETALAQSLKRLKLDYVDLYLIHWPVPARNLYPRVWEKLIQLREKGMTLSIGVSNFHPEYLDALKSSGVVPAVNQVELHPGFANRAVADYNTEAGILTECYCPLGRGQYLSDSLLTDIASRLGATTAQVILAWHLAKGYVPLPKSGTPARIQENFEAQQLTLTEEDVAEIDGISQSPKICADPANFTGL